MNIYSLGTIVRIKNMLLMIVSWNVVDDEQYFEYGGVIYPKSLGSDVMLHCFNTTDIDEVVFVGFLEGKDNVSAMTEAVRWREETKLPLGKIDDEDAQEEQPGNPFGILDN